MWRSFSEQAVLTYQCLGPIMRLRRLITRPGWFCSLLLDVVERCGCYESRAGILIVIPLLSELSRTADGGLFGRPYNKDHTMLGSSLGPPMSGYAQMPRLMSFWGVSSLDLRNQSTCGLEHYGCAPLVVAEAAPCASDDATWQTKLPKMQLCWSKRLFRVF